MKGMTLCVGPQGRKQPGEILEKLKPNSFIHRVRDSGGFADRPLIQIQLADLNDESACLDRVLARRQAFRVEPEPDS